MIEDKQQMMLLVPRRLHSELAEVAKEQQMTMSSFIRRWIKVGILHHHDKVRVDTIDEGGVRREVYFV